MDKEEKIQLAEEICTPMCKIIKISPIDFLFRGIFRGRKIKLIKLKTS